MVKGRLDLMIGSMYSGKSSALLRKLSQFSDIGEKVLYINHSIDTRSNSDYSTHCKLINGSELTFDSMKIQSFKDFRYSKVYDGINKKYSIVGIDEAQFFDESLIDFVLYLVETLDIYVIVVGLDGTFERKPFGNILNLIPYCDNLTKLHAICKSCYSDKKEIVTAIFSLRTVKNKDQVLVGAEDSYIPVCRECYLTLN